jgi:hypothetical protein
MVAKQFEAHVPTALASAPGTVIHAQYAEIRFIAEMYARACYSMLLVSANGPALLRLPVQATAILPWPRGLAIRLGRSIAHELGLVIAAGVASPIAIDLHANGYVGRRAG